jgi:hypothetical protein
MPRRTLSRRLPDRADPAYPETGGLLVIYSRVGPAFPGNRNHHARYLLPIKMISGHRKTDNCIAVPALYPCAVSTLRSRSRCGGRCLRVNALAASYRYWTSVAFDYIRTTNKITGTCI